MRYYSPVSNWHRLKPHLSNPELMAILHRDFNKFTMGAFGRPFTTGQWPCQFEKYEKRKCVFRHTHVYTDWIKSNSCHWLCNFNLKWISLTEPNRAWRIIVMDAIPEKSEHSSVFDGKYTIFDPLMFALGVPVEEVLRICKVSLPPGQQLELNYAHW